MIEPRLIKKYPNRRLYDTELSRYVTIEDVRQLIAVNTGVPVLLTVILQHCPFGDFIMTPEPTWAV